MAVIRVSNGGLFAKETASGKCYWNFKVKLPNGKSQQRSTGIEVKGQRPPAEAIQMRLDALKEFPEQRASRDKRVADVVAEWLEQQRRKLNAKQMGVGNYNNYLSNAKWVTGIDYKNKPQDESGLTVLGKMKARDVRVADLHELQDGSMAASKSGGTRTMEQRLYIVNASLAFAGITIPDGAKFVPVKKKRVKVRVAMTDEIYNHIYRTAMSEKRWWHVANLMLAAVDTCRRPCEFKGLQLERIFVKHPILPWVTDEVLRSYDPCELDEHGVKKPFYGCFNIDSTKSDAGAGMFPLTRRAHMAFCYLLDEAARKGAHLPEHYLLPHLLSRHTKPTDPLYHRRFEGYAPDMPQVTWGTAWNSIRVRAGFPKLDFYALRHTGATAVGEMADVSDLVAIQYTGHADIDTLRDNYQKQARMKSLAKVAHGLEKTNPALDKMLGFDKDKQERQ